MKNYLLEKTIFYRSYQKFVRSKNDEYDFISFIISEVGKKNKINFLDIGCGDSYILSYINKHINHYTGFDFNKKYLENSKKIWKEYNFINSDINDLNIMSKIKKKKFNFIFLHGVIHHLNDFELSKLVKFLFKNFPRCYFLLCDPLLGNNKFLNKIMIRFDRGKFIRDKNNYHKIMNNNKSNNFKTFITDDFYKMSFLNIFHYRNFNLTKYYSLWKTSNKSISR